VHSPEVSHLLHPGKASSAFTGQHVFNESSANRQMFESQSLFKLQEEPELFSLLLSPLLSPPPQSVVSVPASQ
jgi:hypothetical protein